MTTQPNAGGGSAPAARRPLDQTETGGPAIPAARYAHRDGKTAQLRAMKIGSFIDFAHPETNRVRVMAQRLRPMFFRTRTFMGADGWFLRVWRTS